VRQARGEVPEIALFHIGDIRPAHLVENGDAAVAIGHEAPLGGEMPVHLAYAASRQPHVDAGDALRNREIGLRHLSRPAAVLNALWRIVERGPEHRHVAHVRRRRGLSGWKLAAKCRILRPRVGDA